VESLGYSRLIAVYVEIVWAAEKVLGICVGGFSSAQTRLAEVLPAALWNKTYPLLSTSHETSNDFNCHADKIVRLLDDSSI
jgi:hypothetical protein